MVLLTALFTVMINPKFGETIILNIYIFLLASLGSNILYLQFGEAGMNEQLTICVFNMIFWTLQFNIAKHNSKELFK